MALDITKLYMPAYATTAALAALPAAGASPGGGVAARETARDALTWEARPPTPPRIKQGYQHYARQDPGAIVRHFGAARDALPEGPFGAKSKVSAEAAADCLKALPASEVARWRQERAEDVYLSRKREPLGAAPPRGYALPDGLGTATPFGVPLHVREQERLNSTKDIIFPPAAAGGGGGGADRMYARTHGSYAPGEQRKRDYEWPRAGGGGGAALDPAAHRFGLSGAEAARRRSAEQCASMKQILQPELDDGVQHPPAVVTRLMRDHQLTHGDALGRPRPLGAGARAPPRGGAFGAPSAREAEPCVGELIRCGYSPEEQRPDADLGKSLREGFRAAPAGAACAAGAAERRGGGGGGSGGCNASTVRPLLAPPHWAELGVSEEQLAAPRGREGLAALAAAAALDLGEGEFEEVFRRAAAAEGEDGERCDARCSLAAFMAARQQWLREAVGL
ncbi:MAG: hypothetical protein J3K34DRAFT_481434 [Monoraphidium minutum]|nr:MAG: hypothetical protein J3K34DRAFT_481434 [Monoraphidium minutum]